MNTKSFKVHYKHEDKRLFEVIAEVQGISKKQAQAVIDAKQVLVNGKRIWIRKHLVKENDVVEILITDKAPSIPKHIAILWQDQDYMVVNKPAYLLSNASDESVEAMLQKQEKNPQICAVHRLDKETSGCLIFAKSAEAKEAAIPMFRGRDIMKIYRAVTIGKFPSSWKEIRTDIKGLISTTLVKTLDTNKQASYLELRIETGRTHQIRRHLADKRHPVLGDKKYAGTGHELSLEQPRQMLHAYRLIFPHPKTKEAIRATAPLPGDFKKCLAQLKLR
ncbi:RluA family pseudouridine synthase [Pontiella sulfatireligans]|uniref:Ribosomal large subunit pseudouridine synthase D n=1 Tax=Pontiella sulfatireligans TaxID=2750658 RepID=A0A6C2UFR8_9BACT|nr:RluA family pseudouridine synthase [Pontiella sulfatireligans]VGO18056.1 Ribosomal large subunit pseudouridine synthase D [Pontiella sulfatireligans]